MSARSDKTHQAVRLEEASRRAHAAEADGDDAAAIAAWREFRLIRDALRSPEDLLAEGISLSQTVERLIESR